MAGGGGFWVFGYGSLMWRPDFPYLEVRPARLFGFHRALCIKSTIYRGTEDNPGLVLGLDRGGSCVGRAFCVAEAERAGVIAYLDEREMPLDVYHARWVEVVLGDKRRVSAYTYVANRRSSHYMAGLPEAETVRRIKSGRGRAGTALDYLRNTVEHLDHLGIRAGRLHRLLDLTEGTDRSV